MNESPCLSPLERHLTPMSHPHALWLCKAFHRSSRSGNPRTRGSWTTRRRITRPDNSRAAGENGRTSAEAFHSGGGPQKGDLTQIVLIGEGTKYPKQGLWDSDKNNFAPALGFAWSPSFGGKDKTTVRGGVQMTHLLPGNSLSWIDADVGGFPGQEYTPVDLGNGTFRDFSNIHDPYTRFDNTRGSIHASHHESVASPLDLCPGLHVAFDLYDDVRSDPFSNIEDDFGSAVCRNSRREAPLNVVATNTIYANGAPDIVGAIPRKGDLQ